MALRNKKKVPIGVFVFAFLCTLIILFLAAIGADGAAETISVTIYVTCLILLVFPYFFLISSTLMGCIGALVLCPISITSNQNHEKIVQRISTLLNILICIGELAIGVYFSITAKETKNNKERNTYISLAGCSFGCSIIWLLVSIVRCTGNSKEDTRQQQQQGVDNTGEIEVSGVVV